MKIVQRFTTTGIVLLLAVSGGANAKPDTDTNQEQGRGWDSSEITRNRQSRDEDNVRGRERSGERRGRDMREPGSASGEINSDQQTQTDQTVRGADKANERHELKSHEVPAKTQAKPQTKSKTKTKAKKTRKNPRQ
ncbi:hypothetical protein [Candidatus Methylomicrobium oryzae]|uniref:hypothetical protein n=1 Tax=Candidatus Methylomicrobium oryzae TaxID=2802053 RepID=UPI0019220239|nr:hypothetical protein [Methylomicrobium sp. RS1]MBL1262543.1 hypothetical protein [Methylomicrobium sp. RS1]